MEDLLFSLFGVLMISAGLISLLIPERVSRWNDTVGPRWIRDFSVRGEFKAYDGRTKPWQMRVFGGIFLISGTLFVFAGFVGLSE
ncbi:hypothetical protein FF36_06199 [Frankia torreyi]|uniref:SdpI/YhfL protein family n=1 Tax=Frankia torreyi TaxID=1856 RepID=A0A0D8B5X5_9ACTN|nr:hypothetical protein [Frankia sp. ACN1ag]KJE19510.1 hypothetical protein FF36_06199 [Frankia torreyi]